MTIEKLTDRDLILLWDITGKHGANDRAGAVSKALRIINQLKYRVRELEKLVEYTKEERGMFEQKWLEAGKQLTAANALLERACPQSHNEAHIRKWWADRDAHLSVKPAAPTDHDRAVLEACAALDLGEVKLDEDGLTAGEVERIVEAELARREAKRLRGE